MCVVQTGGGSNPSQTKNAIVKVPVSEDIGQAVVIMVLFRVQLQKLFHPNIAKAKGVTGVSGILSGIYLKCKKWKQL